MKSLRTKRLPEEYFTVVGMYGIVLFLTAFTYTTIYIKYYYHAPVAQSVEQSAYNRPVLGSNPSGGTENEKFDILVEKGKSILVNIYTFLSGCGAEAARLFWEQEVEISKFSTQTNYVELEGN